MTLADLRTNVKLPGALPLGLVLMLTIGGAVGWRDLHYANESLSKDMTDLKAAQAIAQAELKAKDAELTAAVTVMRDAAAARQEAVLTRLARIETILERLEKNGRN